MKRELKQLLSLLLVTAMVFTGNVSSVSAKETANDDKVATEVVASEEVLEEESTSEQVEEEATSTEEDSKEEASKEEASKEEDEKKSDSKDEAIEKVSAEAEEVEEVEKVDASVEEELADEETESEDLEAVEEESLEEEPNSCGDGLTWNVDDLGCLTISGSGYMEDYSDSKLAPWVGKGINSVVFESGVKSIGAYAFYNCSSLSGTVEIPATISQIGKSAFNNCTALENLKFEKSYSKISIDQGKSPIEYTIIDGCTGIKTVEFSRGDSELFLPHYKNHAWEVVLGYGVVGDSFYIGRSYSSDGDEYIATLYEKSATSASKLKMSQNEGNVITISCALPDNYTKATYEIYKKGIDKPVVTGDCECEYGSYGVRHSFGPREDAYSKFTESGKYYFVIKTVVGGKTYQEKSSEVDLKVIETLPKIDLSTFKATKENGKYLLTWDYDKKYNFEDFSFTFGIYPEDGLEGKSITCYYDKSKANNHWPHNVDISDGLVKVVDGKYTVDCTDVMSEFEKTYDWYTIEIGIDSLDLKKYNNAPYEFNRVVAWGERIVGKPRVNWVSGGLGTCEITATVAGCDYLREVYKCDSDGSNGQLVAGSGVYIQYLKNVGDIYISSVAKYMKEPGSYYVSVTRRDSKYIYESTKSDVFTIPGDRAELNKPENVSLSDNGGTVTITWADNNENSWTVSRYGYVLYKKTNEGYEPVSEDDSNYSSSCDLYKSLIVSSGADAISIKVWPNDLKAYKPAESEIISFEESGIQFDKYNIEYDPGVSDEDMSEITGTMTTKSYMKDVSGYVAYNEYKRKGYSFVCWLDKRTGTYYGEGASFMNFAEVGSTVTLYALWLPLKYDIIFNANGGTGTMAKIASVAYGTSKVLPANAYKKAGCTFAGWAESPSGDVKYTDKQTVSNLCDGTNGMKSITLYAKWIETEYSINYVLNGGTFEGVDDDTVIRSFKATDAITSLPTPKGDDGYAFEGWYKDSTFKTKVTEIKQGTTADQVLYAKWVAQTYTIKYDKGVDAADEASVKGTIADQKAYYTADVTLAQNKYTRAGYKFMGWSTSKGGLVVYTDKQVVNDSFGYTGESFTGDPVVKTLYAVWVNEFSITYHGNGGVNPDGAIESYVYGKAATLPTPVREGYTFAGWFTDDVTFKSQLKSIGTSTFGDYELYAKWTPNAYSIVLNPNGGSGRAVTQKMVYDTPAKLTAYAKTKFSRKGYDFLGWNTNADATGVPYIDEVSVNNLTPDKNGKVNLYAQWKAIDYNLIFVAMRGDDIPPKQYHVSTKAQPELLPSLGDRDGYTFAGWYKEPTYKTKVTTISANTIGDLVCYAKWTGAKYSIIYHDGIEGSDKTVTVGNLVHGNAVTLRANSFKKPGNVFLGWSTDKDSDSIYGLLGDKTVVHYPSLNDKNEVHLYARWYDTYNVDYELNGGEKEDADKYFTSYKYGIAKELPTPVKAGYDFGGWYSDAKLRTAVKSITATTSGNKTLYAKWNPKKYTVKYVANIPDGQELTGTMRDQVLTYDKASALSGNAYGCKSKGYAFVGWATSAGGDVAYLNKESVKGEKSLDSYAYPESGEITLYGVWDNNFSIAYVLYDGTNPDEAISGYTYNLKTYSSLPTPTKDGYTFAGWYKDSTYKTKVASITSSTVGDLTLHAKWTAKNYNIIFNANAPAGTRASGRTANEKMVFNTSKALTKNGYKISGYTFMGWSTSADGDVVYSDAVPYNMTASYSDKVDLYAVWEKDSYTISWSNAVATGYPVSYAVDSDTIVLPKPERIGYTFVGWYTDAKLTKKASDIKKGSTGNKEFYAKWKLN